MRPVKDYIHYALKDEFFLNQSLLGGRALDAESGFLTLFLFRVMQFQDT